MQIVCPECNARYEVEDQMIPPGGRDVQCSACGHEWFNKRSGAVGGDTDVEAVAKPNRPVPVREVETETADRQREPSAGRPRGLDEDTRRILREEREAEARRRTPRQQPDDPAPDRRPDARQNQPTPLNAQSAPLPRAEAAELPPQTTAQTAPQSRRPRRDEPDHRMDEPRSDRHPNRGVMQSALGADDAASEGASGKGRSGMLTGFLTVVVIVAVLVGLYVFADAVVAQLPAMDDQMESYVATGDLVLERLTDWITQITGVVR